MILEGLLQAQYAQTARRKTLLPLVQMTRGSFVQVVTSKNIKANRYIPLLKYNALGLIKKHY